MTEPKELHPMINVNSPADKVSLRMTQNDSQYFDDEGNSGSKMEDDSPNVKRSNEKSEQGVTSKTDHAFDEDKRSHSQTGFDRLNRFCEERVAKFRFHNKSKGSL
jgi:hypothetical protein